MPNHRRQDLQFSCPSGGKFYAYDLDTRFVGCCTVDPFDKGCNDGNLRPASFNVDASSELRDQQCSMGSRWYTCEDTQPPFLGCCKSNPCQHNGCPVGDLTAGFLDSQPMIAAPFVSAVGSSATKTPSISEATSTPSNPALQVTASKSDKSSSGAIAAGVVGSIVVAALLIIAAVFLIYRRKRDPMPPKRSEPPEPPEPQELMSQEDYSYEKDMNTHENLNNGDLAYPKPTLAGSPIYQHGYQNPPVYSSVNQLNTSFRPLPGAHHNSSELPSPDEGHYSDRRFDPSTNRLRTTTTALISTSQATAATDQYPSPVSTITEGSPGRPNARPNAEVRGYPMAHTRLPMGADMMAGHVVEDYRRPVLTARG